MIVKGDKFINSGPGHLSVVFKCTGGQGSLLLAEVIGFTSQGESLLKVGDKVTLVQDNYPNLVKPNRDILEAAGLTVEEKPVDKLDHKEVYAKAVNTLESAADTAYYKFIDSYLEMMKKRSPFYKEWFTIIAARVEAENLTGTVELSAAKEATALLNALESLEVIHRFYKEF